MAAELYVILNDCKRSKDLQNINDNLKSFINKKQFCASYYFVHDPM